MKCCLARQEEGTGFHAAKSFDNLLCSKSEMMLLATTKEKDSVTNTVRVAVLHVCLYI